MDAYILLDRSGSMATRWDEALSSINAYVGELDPADIVTVALFDAVGGPIDFDVVRNSTLASDWKALNQAIGAPRGMTPLFDAVGKLATLVESKSPDKAVIVIMTDGAENASRECDKAAAEAALNRCRDRNWQVVFLGADFNSASDAAALGASSAQTMAMAEGTYAANMAGLALKSRTYAMRGDAVVFSADDRVRAKESTIKR